MSEPAFHTEDETGEENDRASAMGELGTGQEVGMWMAGKRGLGSLRK